MNIKYLLLSLFFGIFAVGCSSTKLEDKQSSAPQLITPLPAPPAAVQASSATAKNSKSTDPLNDPSSILAKRSIYFDYDSSTVRQEFAALIEAHGKYLATHPERKLVIQGHTDERGGSEYNLALGQRRADAVKNLLQQSGAKDSQLEAISFGKEKPKATGSDEQAWAENRRVDLSY